MKNKLLFLSFLLSYTIFAQSCKEIQKENDYLKQILHINTAEYKTEFDKTEFSITKIEGDIEYQTVTFTILVNNKDVNKVIAMGTFSAIDLEGNEYKKQDFAEIKGLNSLGSDTFNTNVPKKIEPILVKVPANTQLIKLFKFNYYSDILHDYKTIEFRDLKIKWK
ncbi:hypothetical protein [Empedobacter falsenii]|uniref:DUF4352 domain-containing protein n=1 Tax=Empedobacter falsenii TaxID=343874 RepID=A0AAW7DLM3_9FLAO|nr:hypothetical protein [Empedobacter falsenii]MDM1551176.1 hypothetical protein [Empedobacter falsenii]